MARITGAHIVIECLLEQGVDTIFGYPGGTILNVYDALYDYRDQIRHYLTAHEQGASHAADGYARTTGKVGVCFATSGPGATNLTTGIATAYSDSSPVVFLTCNVAEPLLGKDSFQEVDITGISMPITKATYMVKHADQIADVIREAFAVAAAGRPGPVLIDILKNATAEYAEYTSIPYDIPAKLKPVESAPNGRIDTLIKMIGQAKKPALLIGGGVIRSGASKELLALAEKLGAPVATTIMALGSIPGDHPLVTGMVGMHGAKASNYAISRCDLLIAIGARFSDRVTGDLSSFAAYAKKVHIDIDRAEIDKNVITDHHVVGDAKKVLTALNEALTDTYDFSHWMAEVDDKRTPKRTGTAEGYLDPRDILSAVQRIAGDNTHIVTDVGQHQMWSCQHFTYRWPGQLVTSGGFGTMGFGYGAAMGTKIGNPDRTVVHATGDGCFRMNCHELATASHYNIPVITLIFNNGTLGMVRQWQSLLYNGRFSETTLDRGPDFVKLAEAYGVTGYRVTNLSEFEQAFTAALNSGKPAVLDCVLDIDATVRPMVAAAKPLSEYLLD